jgi:UDP-N-acetylmuramate dehydrogenase
MSGLALNSNEQLLNVRGKIVEDAPLGELGWFRAGGRADLMFKPEDEEDLKTFLSAFPKENNVRAFGVMSNSIIRDGGIRGAVIRFGRAFTKIEVLEGQRILAGAAALDGNVAMMAARASIKGLEFFSGIPGTIGGALRMNAGCYGTETKDVLVHAVAIDREGKKHILTAQDMNMGYRYNSMPDDFIFTEALFQGQKGNEEEIKKFMKDIKEKRNASQPIREKTGGSTFANPTAETLKENDIPEGTKVWQLIDGAGCRGLRVGGAQMSELHCNFMINDDGATAKDLELLGEEVRSRVLNKYGVKLRWEIKRIGDKER